MLGFWQVKNGRDAAMAKRISIPNAVRYAEANGAQVRAQNSNGFKIGASRARGCSYKFDVSAPGHGGFWISHPGDGGSACYRIAGMLAPFPDFADVRDYAGNLIVRAVDLIVTMRMTAQERNAEEGK